MTECAYYPAAEIIVIINNSGDLQKTSVQTMDGKTIQAVLEPYDIEIISPFIQNTKS